MSDFGSLDSEPKRDGYGRYLIVPPDGGKARAMTRMTTVSGILDSRHAIEKWQQRHVAVGLASRPDLLAQVQSTTIEDKQTLNSVCQKALDASGADAAASMGTALHRVLERVNLEPSFVPPEPFAERVAEYQRAMTEAGLTVCTDAVERIHVLWPHLCGMADLHAIWSGNGKRFIADYKTGSSVDFGAGGYSVQLAGYSRATSLYRPEDDTHEPMPDVDQDRAIIIHLPAKGGPCRIHWIDIASGAEALEHALFAHKWRSRKDLLTPFDVPEVPNAEPPALEVVRDELQPRRERLLAALRPLKDADKDQFVTVWRRDLAAVPFPNKADEWDGAAMDAVERAFQLAWTDDVVPTVAPESTLPEPRPETPAEDHGGLVEPELLTEAREQIKHLPRGAKGWMMAWQDDAVANGLAWRMGRGPHVSVRSWWTTKAGYWLARLVHGSDADDPQDDARLVLASVLGDATVMPTISVGQCLSSLTVDQASLCCSLAQCAVEGDVRINDQGLLEVAA